MQKTEACGSFEKTGDFPVIGNSQKRDLFLEGIVKQISESEASE